MPDMTAISGVLTSIKTATDIAKIIKDSHKSLEEAEIKLKLADLISNLADAKIEMAALQDTLAEKDKTIDNLNIKFLFSDSLVWRDPLYWIESNDTKEGPFCQKCYDGNEEAIRLQSQETGIWHCTVCSKHYTDDDYQEGRSISIEPDFV